MTTTTRLQPTSNNVLIRSKDPEEVSEGGIYLPETARKDPSHPQCGTVVAVGPGKLLDDGTRSPVDVRVTDVVWFTGGQPITVDGVELFMVPEDEILMLEG